MKKINRKVLEIVERAIRNGAVQGIDGFPPPLCWDLASAEKTGQTQEKISGGGIFLA